MSDRNPSARALLVAAAIATTLIGRFVPHGRMVLYPLTLLATWVHEMGHGLSALAVGGAFDRLEIFADASGLAHTSHAPGVPAAIVCLGGLVAPPLTGALLLVFARGPRRARLVLALLALALVVSTLVFVRSAAGLIAAPLMGLGVFWVVRSGSGREQMFLSQLVALHLSLDTLGRGLSYLFTDAVVVDGERRMSDISGVADGFGGPRLFWSISVSALCIALILLGLFAALRGPRSTREARGEQNPAPSGS